MDRLTGGSLVIRTLELCGAKVLFGIPGVHNLGMYEALQESSLRHVTPRHEQGAGFMADGYARSSGTPGVALVISGPGLTNILTPLGEAYHDSVPLLVISSQIPRSRLGRRTGTLHELKNSTIMSSSVTKASYVVSRGEEIPWIVSRAYVQTLEGRPGPVHVEIPLDILEETLCSSFEDLWRECSFISRERREPASEELRRGVELLKQSEKPALICGGGAAGAAPEVRELAVRLGAPVFSTAAGKGIFPDDAPLSGGCRLHVPQVREYLANRDVLLVIGTELSPADLWEEPFPRGPEIIRVDADSRALQRNAAASVALWGDASRTLQGLLEGLGSLERDSSGEEENVETLRWECTENLQALTGMGKALPKMKAMLRGLRRGIPREGILVMDMTGAAYVGLSEYPAYAPSSYLHPAGFGTLGYALPAAVGATIANPEKKVCLFSGDGGFQFTLPELAAACDEGLSLPVVLWNNRGYGEIRRNQEARSWNRCVAVDLYGPDFCALAEAYGISGEVVDTEEELVEALERAWNRPLPSLIEIRSDREVG
ncbi:MAG TPA: 5-guanidino-2-oxopentanoate decarboxylase [Synergistaceae bacterium]|nr:5-guanidino-2-oxopentanoate decarboxylase [Synergistaceae bacterium]